MDDVISRQDVLDIIEDLRDRMTVECYWSMVELVKALTSTQPEVLACGEGELIAQPEIIHCGVEPRCEACEAFNKTRLLIPQPERKKGKWIKITTGAMREKYMCSICGRTIQDDGIERLVRIRYPFCHCGAEMTEGKG